MDKDILIALVKGEPVPQKLIENALFEMCDREHSSCNEACLVYALNDNSPLNPHRPFNENRGCDCFKNGKAMFDFLKKELTKV